MNKNNVINIKKLTLIATIFALLVIALGAYTRLVHAGLGCPDWPTCYGHLWAPQSLNEISDANTSFPDAPVDLAKTWPEMTHRYLATSLGLLCLIIAGMSLFNARQRVFPFKHSLGLVFAVILQGMFGMWTVTLKLWPQVVTLHLIGGFSTFSLLLLLYLRLNAGPALLRVNPYLRHFSLLLLLVVAMQVMLGGWTTANYAAMACLELPLCDIGALTANDFSQGFNLLQQIGPNYLGGQLDGGARIAIHAMHRIGAVSVSLLGLLLVGWLYYARFKRLAAALMMILLSQVLLGISNVYFHLPLYNAVAHNIGGALLVATLVVINYQLRPQSELTPAARPKA